MYRLFGKFNLQAGLGTGHQTAYRAFGLGFLRHLAEGRFRHARHLALNLQVNVCDGWQSVYILQFHFGLSIQLFGLVPSLAE